MKEQDHYKRFIEKIVGNSTTSTWEEAKLEWYCYNVDEDTSGTCICGHKLGNLYYIKNKINGKTLIVGSSCVKKFGEKSMVDYVKRVEKKRAEKKAKEKRLADNEKYYETLKAEQLSNNIPLSIRKPYVEKRYKLNIINNFEFTFYTQVWNYTRLSEKQKALKEKINQKLLKAKI